MNSTKKNSEFGGVKKKLTAAIAMLLVATIMMVSSTYAWFTLSTAPEVTGITTSVGANGNLEMALLHGTKTDAADANDETKKGNTYADPTRITSNVGDSSAAQEVTKANITWGDLVDLSDASYGLNNIKLNPARLNVTGNQVNGAAPVLVAEYGSDGRVSKLTDATVSGVYKKGTAEGNTSTEYFVAGDDMGVRALGTASGMSDEQIAYRNALAYIATNTIQAREYAQQSLNLYGSALADMAIKHETTEPKDSDTYTQTDIDNVNALLDLLRQSRSSVETALKYAVLAQVSSKTVADADKAAHVDDAAAATTATKARITAVQTAITQNKTLDEVIAAATGVEVNQEGSAFNTAYKSLKDDLNVPDRISASDNGTYGWATISTVMNKIMTTSAMKLNGIKINEVKTSENMNKLISDLTAGKGFTLIMGTGSGIYDTIAQFAGNVSAQVHLSEFSYGGIKLTAVTPTMKTEATAPYKLASVSTAMNALGKPDKASDTEEVITDSYAFAIDMAFRTNAAGANLLLQTEAVNRIYDGSTNEDTQGHGSTYTFTVTNGVDETAAKKLADCIHIVFAKKDGTVVAVAGLDSTTMKSKGNNSYTANVVLQNANVTADGLVGTGEGGKITKKDSAVISGLEQNTALVLSAYVFLDGDAVDNSMVSANATSTMTGKLSLQFSTDVELKPMDYTPLKQNTTGHNG